MLTFAETMEVANSERGWKAADLVRATGLSDGYISKLMNGRVAEPSWSKACRIIDGYEMGLDDFRAMQEDAETQYREGARYCTAEESRLLTAVRLLDDNERALFDTLASGILAQKGL